MMRQSRSQQPFYARQAGISLTEMAKPYNNGLNRAGQSEANRQLAERLFRMIE